MNITMVNKASLLLIVGYCTVGLVIATVAPGNSEARPIFVRLGYLMTKIIFRAMLILS